MDWMFTTPLMLIELGILAGAQPAQTITLIAAGRNMLKLPTIRRKFRSQTVEMDRCSNSDESSRSQKKRERVRREEVRQETDRREEVRQETDRREEVREDKESDERRQNSVVHWFVESLNH